MLTYLTDFNIIISTNLILTIFTAIIVFFIFFIISSFFLLRFLQTSFEFNNVFFYQYNKKCQKMIDEYGECKINKMYIVLQPLGKIAKYVFNVLTLFNYNKYLVESNDTYPYPHHSALIFEINYNNAIKFILVEKNNFINISETFLLHNAYEFKQINIQKNKFTLNKILNPTLKRMGIHKYFNWNIYKNNCQEFTKEILITLNKYSKKSKNFIFRDKIIHKYYSPTDFTLHILNCVLILLNFIEKYLIDNNIFY